MMNTGGCVKRHEGTNVAIAVAAIVAAVAAILAVVVVVAVAGCAGQQQQRMGQTYMAAGDYDRAVAAAQQAVASSPDNPEYQDLLSDAQTAAADFHFEQANKLMATRQIGAAKTELVRVLGYMSAHPGANTLQVKVDQAIAQRDELIAKAREAAVRSDWDSTVQMAYAACRMDEGDKRAQDLFAQAQSNVMAGHMAKTPPAPVATPSAPAATPSATVASPPPATVASPPPANQPTANQTTAGPQALILVERPASQPQHVADAGTRATNAGRPTNAGITKLPPNTQRDRHLFVGTISRGDRRFNKTMAIMDGLVVKVCDTDKGPLDADLEIVAGKFKISPNDVPVGGSVKIQGVSRRQYKLTILWIDHENDTMRFAIDRTD